MLINRKLITYGINYIKTAGLATAFLMVLKVLSGRVAVSKLDKYTSPEISSMSSFLEKAMAYGGCVSNLSLINNARKSSFAAVCIGKGWSQEDSIAVAEALAEKGLVPVFISCSSLLIPDTAASVVIDKRKSEKLISASSSVFSCILFAEKVSEKQVLQLSGKRVPVVWISGKKKKADNLIKFENNIHFVHKGKPGNRDLPIDTVSGSAGNWLLEVSRIIDLFVYVVPNELSNYDGTISVVIPTYNGKNDLQALVPALKSQKLVNSIQIIAIDSGSTDGTLEYLSNEAGVAIFCIPHESFSHSYARNLGFSKAAGEYVLFMTQDALPPDDLWLRMIVDPLLRDSSIVASSCNQIPRNNCNLYGAYSIYAHTEYLGVLNCDRICVCPRNINDKDLLRRNSQLDDVSCIVRYSIFERYMFESSFAEDLNLGVRLISDGFRIVQRATSSVIHSHSRTDFYYLQRAIIDKIGLGKQFGCSDNRQLEYYDAKSKIISLFIYSNLFVSLIQEYKFYSYNELLRSLNDIQTDAMLHLKEEKRSNNLNKAFASTLYSKDFNDAIKLAYGSSNNFSIDLELVLIINLQFEKMLSSAFFIEWNKTHSFDIESLAEWIADTTAALVGGIIGEYVSAKNYTSSEIDASFFSLYRTACTNV